MASKQKPTRVYVGSLDIEVTADDLWDELGEYGDIADIALHTAKSGECQYAILTFKQYEEAAATVEDLDGSRKLWISGGRALKVQIATDRERGGSSNAAAAAAAGAAPKPASKPAAAGWASSSGSELPPGVKELHRYYIFQDPPTPLLWVGSMSKTATTQDMKSLFTKYGLVASVEASPAPNGSSKFGFVQFNSAAQAERAKKALDGTTNTPLTFKGDKHKLKLRYACPKSQGLPKELAAEMEASQLAAWAAVQVTPEEVAAATKVLWIGNLEAYPDAASLERIFSIFGTVDNVKAFNKALPGSPPKLFAFVTFVDKASSAKALKALDGKRLPSLTGSKPLMIEYQFSEHNPAPQGLRAGAREGPAAAPAAAGLATPPAMDMQALSLSAGSVPPAAGMELHHLPTDLPPEFLLPEQQQQQQQQLQQQQQQQQLWQQENEAAQHAAATQAAAPHAAAAAGAAAGAAPPLPPVSGAARCCAYCGTSEAALGHMLSECTGCRCTYFCDTQCHHAAWGAFHHADCSRLAALLGALEGQPQCVELLQAGLEQPLGHEAALVRSVLARCLGPTGSALHG